MTTSETVDVRAGPGGVTDEQAWLFVVGYPAGQDVIGHPGGGLDAQVRVQAGAGPRCEM